MRKITQLLLLALASTVVAHAEECQLKRYGTVPFETDERAHIYVPVTIQGRKTRLQLDTGAYWSTIRRDLVEELKLPTHRSLDMELVDLSGEKMKDVAMAPELVLGGLRYGETEMFISNVDRSIPIEQEGGLLGQNMLQRMDLEIDNAGKTISLFNQDHCKGGGVYWADEAVTLYYKKEPAVAELGTRLKRVNKNQIDLPIVLAEMEGEKVSVLFDTGATYTSIDLDVARRRFGITLETPGVKPAGQGYVAAGGLVDTYSYTIKSLTIAGIHFENVPIRLAKFDDSTQVLLGMNEMRHLRIYFAFGEGLVHVTAADATRSAEPQPQQGQ